MQILSLFKNKKILLFICAIFIIILGVWIMIQMQNKNYSNFAQQPLTQNIIESKGEQKCRNFLEKIFNKPFKRIRPNWLKNYIPGKDGRFRNLELDCYNDDLKLAVEYNGPQHYHYTRKFHRNRQDFLDGQHRDYIKHKICEENGIILIVVPYWIKDIENFLTDQLIEKLNLVEILK